MAIKSVRLGSVVLAFGAAGQHRMSTLTRAAGTTLLLTLACAPGAHAIAVGSDVTCTATPNTARGAWTTPGDDRVEWHSELGNNTGNYYYCGTLIDEKEYEIKMDKGQTGGGDQRTDKTIVTGEVYDGQSTGLGITAQFSSLASPGTPGVEIETVACFGSTIKPLDTQGDLITGLKIELLDGWKFSDLAASVALQEDGKVFGIQAVGKDGAGNDFNVIYGSTSTISSGLDDFFLYINDGYFDYAIVWGFGITGLGTTAAGDCDITSLEGCLDGNLDQLQNFEISGLQLVPLPAAAWLFG